MVEAVEVDARLDDMLDDMLDGMVDGAIDVLLVAPLDDELSALFLVTMVYTAAASTPPQLSVLLPLQGELHDPKLAGLAPASTLFPHTQRLPAGKFSTIHVNLRESYHVVLRNRLQICKNRGIAQASIRFEFCL